jgi:drug/metabolite transporter (DMT)-like permease
MWLAHLGLLITAFAWGSQIPALTVLFERWDPYFLAAARYVLAAPVLLLILLLWEGGRFDPRPLRSGKLWLLGLALGLFVPLYTLGIAHANPNTAAILGSAGPVIAAFVAWAGFALPLPRALMPAVLLALAGGVLATYDPARPDTPFDIRGGEVLIVLAAICWNWYSLAAQRWLAGWSQIRISSMTMVPGAIVSVVVYAGAAALGEVPWPTRLPDTALDIGLILWMTLMAVIAGLFFWNYGVLKAGLLVSSIYLNFVPVFAVAITSALGTPPTALQLLGGMLVLASVVYAQRRPPPT